LRRTSEHERQSASADARVDDVDPVLRRIIRDEVRSALESARSKVGIDDERTRT
jgi:hypothetical protein